MIAHEIFAPLTAEQFLREVWNRSPIHLPGKAGRFEDLLEWDSLARLLETRPLEPPRIALTRNGKAIAETLYLTRLNGLTYLNAGALSLLLDQGATLIINSVEALEPR